MITANNLRKEFSRQEKKGRKTVKTKIRAVDGISFTAHDGEALGILGPQRRRKDHPPAHAWLPHGAGRRQRVLV